jgi:hypothetical protein
MAYIVATERRPRRPGVTSPVTPIGAGSNRLAKISDNQVLLDGFPQNPANCSLKLRQAALWKSLAIADG